jgi:hypothetical protein
VDKFQPVLCPPHRLVQEWCPPLLACHAGFTEFVDLLNVGQAAHQLLVCHPP